MPTEPVPFGTRASRAFTRFLIFLLVIALLAAVTFLLSQLNARRFRIAVEDGNAIVLKGRQLPSGFQPFQPTDARQRDAYAPLPLHGLDASGLGERTFEDRDELDRALFDLLRALAEPRLREDDAPERLQEGLYYLQRANLLTGTTPEQRLTLTQMQTDIAYYRGRSMLAQAQRLVAEAREQLHAAAKTENPHTRSAQQMLLEVETPAIALDDALRRAVNQLSTPRAPAPPPLPPPPAPPTSEGGAMKPLDAGLLEPAAP